MQFDKSIHPVNLYEFYFLICIFMKIYENLKNETIDPGEGVRRLLIRPLLYPEGIFFSCRRNCLVEPPKCQESCPESKPVWAM